MRHAVRAISLMRSSSEATEKRPKSYGDSYDCFSFEMLIGTSTSSCASTSTTHVGWGSTGPLAFWKFSNQSEAIKTIKIHIIQ